MDSGTIISIVILALLVISPFILMKRKQLKKEKLFLQSLAAIAEKSGSKIIEHDIWNNSVIGIDTNTHKLFFLKRKNENQIHQEIDLYEIQRCKLNNISRTMNTTDGKQTVVEKLELIFVNRDHSKPETSIEFYNSKVDSLTINEEFKLTDKWLEIINIELLNTGRRT